VVIKHHFGCVRGRVDNNRDSGFTELTVVNKNGKFDWKMDIEVVEVDGGGDGGGKILRKI